MVKKWYLVFCWLLLWSLKFQYRNDLNIFQSSPVSPTMVAIVISFVYLTFTLCVKKQNTFINSLMERYFYILFLLYVSMRCVYIHAGFVNFWIVCRVNYSFRDVLDALLPAK